MATHRSFDVSLDDQQFLMVRRHEEGAGGASAPSALVLVIVEHWLEDVDQIMTGAGR